MYTLCQVYNPVRYIAGQLPTSEPVAAELFDALIAEIEKLQDRIAALEHMSHARN